MRTWLTTIVELAGIAAIINGIYGLAGVHWASLVGGVIAVAYSWALNR